MSRVLSLKLEPEFLHDEQTIRSLAAQAAGISEQSISEIHILKRSIDARSRSPYYNIQVEVLQQGEQSQAIRERSLVKKDVRKGKRVLIVGSGPGGLFAAIKLIELGHKPVILERGKDIRSRRRDLAAINKAQLVNPDSNYCFGEGGAGTYSDGKLFTRSAKRGNVGEVLSLLVSFGAHPDITVDAHPHIGTNKLPKIIENIRSYILDCGGEIHFETRMTNFKRKGQWIEIEVTENRLFMGEAMILATGHSARDVFEMFQTKKLQLEAKPFALGVRIEHPQAIIDSIQYHCPTRHPNLPPAAYSLVHQVRNQGVYSFCMCPGGIIAPCATQQEEIVTNGWSPSKRNNPFANSGIVVEITPQDFHEYGNDPLAAMRYQAAVEHKAWMAGGKSQVAPAQRVTDFVRGRRSSSLPESSYQPGTESVELGSVLPEKVYRMLQEGFLAFGKKMRGYLSEEAVVHAVESRTSSPVRIPRDHENLQHPNFPGLFPCGEGAGYAGGIVSAAMDGMRCAEKAVSYLA